MPFNLSGEVIDMGAVDYTVPAGRYFLGDPCYAVPREFWSDLLDSCDYFRQQPGTANGHHVVAFDTAYGDGGYLDNYGNSYCVDAGLIGLTPAELFLDEEYLKSLGSIVEFTEPTRVTHDGFGRMTFGDYSINTNDDNTDDDYEAEDWDEEEEGEDY